MKVLLERQAAKTLKRLDAVTKQRIVNALKRLPAGDIKPLQGEFQDELRLRVGDWRVLFYYGDDSSVIVVKIAPRGQAYKEV
jgi:mRNA interferase RelE/StbE